MHCSSGVSLVSCKPGPPTNTPDYEHVRDRSNGPLRHYGTHWSWAKPISEMPYCQSNALSSQRSQMSPVVPQQLASLAAVEGSRFNRRTFVGAGALGALGASALAACGAATRRAATASLDVVRNRHDHDDGGRAADPGAVGGAAPLAGRRCGPAGAGRLRGGQARL